MADQNDTSIVQDVADLFRSCGFEVREDANHQFAVSGSLDSAGVLVEAVMERLSAPVVPAVDALTNAEIRTIMHKYSRFMGGGTYSDTEFDCLQDVIAFARAVLAAHPADAGAAPVTGEEIYRAMYEHEGGKWECVETKYVWRDVANRLNNLIATRRAIQAAPEATDNRPDLLDAIEDAEREKATSEQMGGAQVVKGEPFAYAGVWRGNSILTSLDRKSVEDWVNYSAGRSMVELFDHPAPTTERAAAPADLSNLTRHDHRGALMVPDATGDYFLVSDVRDFLATPRAAEGEATERKPLTYMEIFDLSCAIPLDTDDHDVALVQAVEQHHGIGSDK